jgi:hypothetical protein
MWRKISIYLILLGNAISLPVRAFAQTQQPSAPPWDYWFGPGFMWGGGWSSFWWICPLMVVVMMLAMMFAYRFMCSRRRD